ADPDAAQVQGVGRAGGRDKPERVGEPLGRVEVRLLELEPRQVLNLDHRVLRPAGAVTPLGALLAVQVRVRRLRLINQNDLLTSTDESISLSSSGCQALHQN